LNQPDEPLHLSAPLAWELAPALCHQDPVTGESCAWNHGFWQILRILDLAGSAAQRGPLYRRVVASAAPGQRSPRVLICGAADYAMLAQILPAARASEASSSITIVDICETPLTLNRWYAQRHNATLETIRSDILRYEAAECFDVICADYLFGRLAPALWPALISRWKTLLKPGGTVVTACRLRLPDAPERIGFSAQQAADFKATVRQRTAAAHSLPISAAEMDRAADIYAAKNMTYSVRSAENIKQYFELAGLEIEEFVVTEGTAMPDAGPSVVFRSSGTLRIVARRP
jgi:SAM-dependent methyltransferase